MTADHCAEHDAISDAQGHAHGDAAERGFERGANPRSDRHTSTDGLRIRFAWRIGHESSLVSKVNETPRPGDLGRLFPPNQAASLASMVFASDHYRRIVAGGR